MYSLLWLIPIVPLAGFLLLSLFGGRLPRAVVSVIGVGTVALSAVLAILLGIRFLLAPPIGAAYTFTLWPWMSAGGFTVDFRFRLDALSLLMVVVVTFVGALIHLYSTAFMARDTRYSRFFALMNLFVASMLILVLADNLLLLFLGWEGVGVCSYLLIGFWHHEPANGRAAMKAFIVTRIGDTALLLGMLLLLTALGTLQISEILTRAAEQWTPGSALAVTAAALLLAGALGKSAQLPLQVWLPDAMAGPTPVSALIHAATMVTAGVYLIARMHVLFTLAPAIQLLVAVIGAITLLVAGCSALVQWDLKRVLAYSTISQVGYMFLALGVGAWTAAMLHFFTHAFFKSLLFLGAGVVTLHLHHETNMAKMGGLRKVLPLTFWTFLIGSLSMSALPFLTAGFYSKDLITFEAWAAARGNPWLWAAAWTGTLLTSLYAFRMVFYVFFGERKHAAQPAGINLAMAVPLVLLAILSLVSGFLELPRTLGNVHLFSQFLHTVLPPPLLAHGAFRTELALQLTAEFASLAGIALAYLFFQRTPASARKFAESPFSLRIKRWWAAGWGFDWIYDRLLVRPFVWLARGNRDDLFDLFFVGIARLSVWVSSVFRSWQTGNLRWYAASLAIGAVVLIGLMVFRW